MASELPPPTYSLDPPNVTSGSDTPLASGPEILIIPTAGTINFQKGYLGADGERAAIEGELQLKGADPNAWVKVTVSLRTVEAAYQQEIELGSSEVVLYGRSSSEQHSLPSTFLFSIPLMPDTPQSIRTPHSYLSHTLTATLHPLDPAVSPLAKSIIVHTKRYTSHLHTCVVSPETHSLDHPTHVEVELPRSTFKTGEPIPIYVTIPPPNRELVVNERLRLRNVRAELVRTVKVKRDDGEDNPSDSDAEFPSDYEDNEVCDEGTSVATTIAPLPAKQLKSPLFLGSSYRTVIARSGASCRFHSSRPVRLRFVLHQSSPSGSPSNFHTRLPASEYGDLDSDAECASITQTTLLHAITFRLNIHVSFVDMASRTERISSVVIPLVLLPPPAPLPEVEPAVDEAYQKKHDRPPVRTNRQDEADSAPHYFEGEAGPSGLPSWAPPPFEERDVPPPPFFSSAAEASTSNRLPTFQESESEIILPEHTEDSPPIDTSPIIIGEGTEFGFPASQQFDGHSEDMQRSSTPPPTLEMASRDTNLTELAEIREPERAMEALGLVVLDQHEEIVHGGELPPPPPALDDPSDPPPSIDSEFRAPDMGTSPPRISSPSPRPGYTPTDSPRLHSPPLLPSGQDGASHGHAPPPYLGVPQQAQDHVARPPPYVD